MLLGAVRKKHEEKKEEPQDAKKSMFSSRGVEAAKRSSQGKLEEASRPPPPSVQPEAVSQSVSPRTADPPVPRREPPKREDSVGRSPRDAATKLTIAEIKAAKAKETASLGAQTPPPPASVSSNTLLMQQQQPQHQQQQTPVQAGRAVSGWGSRVGDAKGGSSNTPTVRGQPSAASLTPKQEKEFEEMLTTMNLPAAGRGQMLNLPAAQKLELLESHKAKLKSVKLTDKGGKVLFLFFFLVWRGFFFIIAIFQGQKQSAVFCECLGHSNCPRASDSSNLRSFRACDLVGNI